MAQQQNTHTEMEKQMVKAPEYKTINGHTYICIHRYPVSKVEAQVWANELRKKPYINSVRVVKVNDGWCAYSAFLG